MSRGFVIIAIDAVGIDYMKCAVALALSIRRVMPNESICLVTDKVPDDKSMFDFVIPLPMGDLDPTSNWKLINDWQVYDASPYDETIKLEADMYIPSNIDYLWEILSQKDVVVCDTVRNFRGEVSTRRFYRRFIDDNDLPDCYNAITYFKKSDTAKRFFEIVRDVFENWVAYKAILQCSPTEDVTTDWAYAIASHLIGKENTQMPGVLSMIHMKQYINDTPTENWTDTLISECFPDQIRINTIPQMYPLHYHIKGFASIIESTYV